MIFLSIAKFEPDLRKKYLTFSRDRSIAFELRLDLFPSIDLELVRRLLQNSARPIMLTLRKESHGGKFEGSETERETVIQKLLRLAPDFFDLEYDMRPDFLNEVFKNYPKTKFILSYHNFQETPANLDEINQNMRRYLVYGYKIAALACSTTDALKMLNFAKKNPKTSTICMGEKGSFARVLGPVVGNLINYASVDSQQGTAPGQIALSELKRLYPRLDARTAIYGLIGDPVVNSPGHLYHNAFFRKQNYKAVYVKMAVKAEELGCFLCLAKELGIRGLSVTRPLKEVIVPFVDELDFAAKEIGAVNTLLFEHGKIFGTNTDGFGALDAIEKKKAIRGKKVVLLGAGGVARAIAFEARARGAEVLILNRTLRRAKELAVIMGCEAGGLEEVPDDYDVLINCSSDCMPIDPRKILPKTLAMDVVYFPRETSFLKEAALKGCQTIYGEEMFLNQAAGQLAFWMR